MSDDHGWSALADGWAATWGRFATPAQEALISATEIGARSRVLDVGCGSGEFLSLLVSRGAVAAGADPATRMLELARLAAPTADLRPAGFDHLPWAAASFEVVTAINALQFADDTEDALAEAIRVTVPGGLVAVANWAEAARNDLNRIEEAVAASVGDDVAPDGELRVAGGLEELFVDVGLEVVSADLVLVPWQVPDDEALIRGVLLGEDAAGRAERAPVVLAAARPYRTAHGGYLLSNAFRYAVGRTRG
jgi:SAM-dependent methyltransferase